MKQFLLLALFSFTTYSQSILKFDKRNVECENKWVVFQMAKDSTYTYGFIYMDSQAGLTFNLEGDFKIDKKGKFINRKSEKTSMIKARLQPNDVALAEIPASKFRELDIKKEPEWLKNYKKDENSMEYLFRWGYLYNGYNECEKALTFLEKAQKINPDYKDLSVELAFSYNALGQFQKAIDVLGNTLKKNQDDCYVRKELIYALVHLKQYDKASKTFEEGLNTKCESKKFQAEMAYNIAYQYFLDNDKVNFEIWSKKSMNLSNQYAKNIEILQKELK